MVGTARAGTLGTAAADELGAARAEIAARAEDAAALEFGRGAETALGAVASGVGSPQAAARSTTAPTLDAPQLMEAA